MSQKTSECSSFRILKQSAGRVLQNQIGTEYGTHRLHNGGKMGRPTPNKYITSVRDTGESIQGTHNAKKKN